MRSLHRVAAAGALSISASVAEAQQLRLLDIPAGNLQQAVIALGRQARISIAMTDTSLARIQVPRVRGRMTVEQALRRLLAGTPATYVSLGGSSYRVVRSAA